MTAVEDIGVDNVRYFGVPSSASSGHRLSMPGQGRRQSVQRTTALEFTPWDGKLDMGLAPGGGGWTPPAEQHQGESSIHYQDGWTAWAFWDRTGDDRRNSNSVFLAFGRYTFDEMKAVAAHYFPEIWERVCALDLRVAEENSYER